MQKYLLIIVFVFSFYSANSQELNCSVSVISSKITGSNKQVFSAMEKSMSDFMNNTHWSKKTFKKQEKIQCALTFNVSEQSSKRYKGTIQIQVARPVYDSTYLTSTLNYQDENVDFIYEEFQSLEFNESAFESNLTSLLSFYAYIILGFDSDSFSLKGGEEYFKIAEKIMLTAQQGGNKGWSSLDGNTTRFKLIDGILNNSYLNYRTMMYDYHIKGLDVMSKKQVQAKKAIANATIKLKQIYLRRPSAYLLRIFLDTKSDEIESIFKDGKKIDTRNLKGMLIKVFPARNKSWNKIN